MLKDFALFFLLSQIIMVFLRYRSLSWEESDYLLLKTLSYEKVKLFMDIALGFDGGSKFCACDDDDEGDVGAPKELLGTWLWYGEEITFNANGMACL